MRDIVFLHGGDHGGWCWERVIACLAAHPDLFGKAVALDAPGCGLKRGRPTEGLSVADVVAELNADVRAAGVKDAIIVGQSLAGVIVPRMVTADPDLYSQVVMLTMG